MKVEKTQAQLTLKKFQAKLRVSRKVFNGFNIGFLVLVALFLLINNGIIPMTAQDASLLTILLSEIWILVVQIVTFSVGVPVTIEPQDEIDGGITRRIG